MSFNSSLCFVIDEIDLKKHRHFYHDDSCNSFGAFQFESSRNIAIRYDKKKEGSNMSVMRSEILPVYSFASYVCFINFDEIAVVVISISFIFDHFANYR